VFTLIASIIGQAYKADKETTKDNTPTKRKALKERIK
jgi:hypothetical protein